MDAKTVEQSKVTIGNLMQPEHANPSGNVHGGEIMKMMDHAAGIVAARHSRKNVVTASKTCSAVTWFSSNTLDSFMSFPHFYFASRSAFQSAASFSS